MASISIIKRGMALLAGVLLFVGLVANLPADAADDQQALQTVTQRIDRLKQSVDGRSAYYRQHQRELRQLLEQTIVPVADFPYISARVMGQYYRGATAQQRAAFATAFQNSALDTLTHGLVSFDYESLNIASSALRSRYDDQVDVALDVASGDGKHYPVSFTMGVRNGEWKVINVIVNGLNLGLTFRNQFDQAMQQNGNNYDAVIGHWDSGAALNKVQSRQPSVESR